MRADVRVRPLLAAASFVLGLLVPALAQAHTVTCNIPEEWNYALIRQEFAGKYDHAGSIACDDVVESISIKCWAVHRHRFIWHSHHDTDIADSFPNNRRVTVGFGPLFSGTRGDDYKTHCDGKAVHGTPSKWSRESAVIRLW